jgi:hypothetical protein
VYVYFAEVLDVHDSDTISVSVDLGFRTWHHAAHLRIAGISGRELSMPGGPEARDHLAGLLPIGARVVVRSIKADRDPAESSSTAVSRGSRHSSTAVSRGSRHCALRS